MRPPVFSIAATSLLWLAVIATPAGNSLAATIHVPEDYSSIQTAINHAGSGDTVLVGPGTYYESLDYGGREIVVRSTHGPLQTTITNTPSQTLVRFHEGETAGAVLEGFRLEGGWIGIRFESSAATIRHNILSNQHVNNWAAISLSAPGGASPGPCPAVIVNNTVVGSANGGLSTFSTVPPVIKNNIFAFNNHYGMHKEGIQPGVAYPLLSYNDVYGNPVPYYELPDHGPGSIELNPLLASDQSLQPGSPCINAGDPDPIYNDPDGSRNDMGAVPTGVPIQPQTMISPDPMLAVFANEVDAAPAEVLVGDIVGAHTTGDVNPSTLLINESLTPLSATLLLSKPGWTGPVWLIEVDLGDFVQTYPAWWDVTNQFYSVSGNYSDGQPFVFAGGFTAFGHISGDLTGDGVVDISDLVAMIQFQFGGGEPPAVMESADVNGGCDGSDISDIVYLVEHMFVGGPSLRHCIDQPIAPPPPGQ